MYKTLRILSDTCGIEPHYTDARGKTHHTDPETSRRILESKGIRIPYDRMQVNPQVLVVSTDNLPERLTVYFTEKVNDSDLTSPTGTVRISESTGTLQASEYASWIRPCVGWSRR